MSVSIGVIDSENPDCVWIQQDQISAIQTFGNTTQAHRTGSKICYVSQNKAYITLHFLSP
jgi:hypothetical protein